MTSMSAPREGFSGTADIVPAGVFVLFVGTIVLAPTAVPLHLLGLLVVAGFLVHRIQVGGDPSLFLLLPSVMSAFQNVYLLTAVDRLTTGSLQVILVLNFLFALVLIACFGILRKSVTPLAPRAITLVRSMMFALAIVAGWGIVSAAAFGAEVNAAFASLRNVTAPIIFLLVGLLAAQWASPRRYIKYLVWLTIAVSLFGFYERFFTTRFWQTHNLAGLWELKEIPVSVITLVPPNFYSSEMIGGKQTIRMVSGFADPVNFGTFLFIGAAGALFLGRRGAATLAVVCTVFAISKGALLGFLVLAVIWARYKADRVMFYLALAALGAVAGYFYLFTISNSTGSTTAHVNGFLAAFTELPGAPLGHGLGKAGVVGRLFSQGSSESTVSESGIGVIIGQLGLFGIVGYGIFFLTLFRRCVRLPDTSERVLAVGGLLAFATNAAFNEVALSPNSCAPYFIVIGLLLGGHYAGGAADRTNLPRRTQQNSVGTLRRASQGAGSTSRRRSGATTAPTALPGSV